MKPTFIHLPKRDELSFLRVLAFPNDSNNGLDCNILSSIPVDESVLGVADGVLKADGDPIYEAKDMKVGLFQSDNK